MGVFTSCLTNSFLLQWESADKILMLNFIFDSKVKVVKDIFCPALCNLRSSQTLQGCKISLDKGARDNVLQ